MFKKAWDWFKDKMVITPLAYVIIYSMVFGYAVWLGVCWCWRKFAACFYRKQVGLASPKSETQAGEVSTPAVTDVSPAPAVPSASVPASAPVRPVGGSATPPSPDATSPAVASSEGGASSPPWSEQLMVGGICLASITVYIVSGWSAGWILAVAVALLLLWCLRKPATHEWLVEYVHEKLVPAAHKLCSGAKGAAFVIFTGVALVTAVWGVIYWLNTFRFMYALQLPVIGGWDWFYAIVGRMLLIVAISFAFGTALVQVETNHWRFVTFCGKRTRRVVGEGWHLVFPFYLGGLTKDVQKTTSGVPIEVTAQVQSDEDEKLMMGVAFKDGRVLYSEDTSDRDTLNSYILVENKAMILQEIASTAKQEINIVGGNTKFTDCRKSLEAIVRLINCKLRLEECPHVNPKYHLSRVLPKGDPRLAELTEDDVPVEKRLDFYVKWGKCIDQILKISTSRSELERRLGVVIKEFKVGDLDYSPEVKAAMEKRTLAAAEIAAAEKRSILMTQKAGEMAGKLPEYQLAALLAGVISPEKYTVAVNSFPEGPKIAAEFGKGIAEGITRALMAKKDG